MSEIIEEKLFDNPHLAWEYMVKQQKIDDCNIYSIPSKDTSRVIISKKISWQSPLKLLPEGFSAPMIGSDSLNGIGGVQSMADGKYYDSKSEYRKSLKAHGYIEVGNEKLTGERDFKGQTASKAEIHKALQEVKRRRGE